MKLPATSRRGAAALLALALCAASPAAAPDTDPYIRFAAAQAGVALEGRFTAFDSRLQFDPKDPARGAVEIQVDLRSVDAGGKDANDMLRSAGFFDAAHFDHATFKAQGFETSGAGQYLAHGHLTIKGHTAEVPVSFRVSESGGKRWVDGSITLSRLAYGVGQGEWSDTSLLDDAVQVRFRLANG